MRTPTPSPASRPPRLAEQFATLDWTHAHRIPVQMRYSDIDGMGHLNNAVYVQYLETSRVMLFKELLGNYTASRSVVARLELDYISEIKLGQEVTVETLVEHLGQSSMVLISRINADGQACALSRVVQVQVDEGMQPVTIPEETRQQLGVIAVREAEA